MKSKTTTTRKPTTTKKNAVSLSTFKTQLFTYIEEQFEVVRSKLISTEISLNKFIKDSFSFELSKMKEQVTVTYFIVIISMVFNSIFFAATAYFIRDFKDDLMLEFKTRELTHVTNMNALYGNQKFLDAEVLKLKKQIKALKANKK